MKISFLATALLSTLFCGLAAGQRQATINFDFRNATAGAATSAGATRPRTAGRSGRTLAAAVEREVFALINEERRKAGLQDLEWNEGVASVARLHSDNMASAKFFSHRGTDGSMVDDRADRVGLGSWLAIGENIAYMRGFDNPAEIAVEKWMESTAHRKNLLGPNWKESAVGVSISEDGTYYMTEVFLLRK